MDEIIILSPNNEELIKELEEADATLEGDEYKSWCQVRLAISSAQKRIERVRDLEQYFSVLKNSTGSFVGDIHLSEKQQKDIIKMLNGQRSDIFQ